MTDNRTLTAFGIGDVVVGLIAWALTGNAVIGLALVLAGIGVLTVAAVRNARSGATDPEAALRNKQADEAREQGETAATTENAEDRPPATGG